MLDTQILETSEYQIFTSLAFLFHLIIRPEFRLNGIPDALTQVCYSNGIKIRHHSGSKQFSAVKVRPVKNLDPHCRSAT